MKDLKLFLSIMLVSIAIGIAFTLINLPSDIAVLGGLAILLITVYILIKRRIKKQKQTDQNG